MEETFPIKAIVLDRFTYREFDSRIGLYAAKLGRFDLIARGTKRPKSKMAGHLEPMNEVNLMVVKGRQYDYVGSAICENSFPNLKGDYDKLEIAGRAISIFKKNLEPSEPDVELYELLVSFLDKLNSSPVGQNSIILYYCFALKFVALLGYPLQMEVLCSCQKEVEVNNYFFNYISGGLVCKICAKKFSGNLLISQKTVELLKKMVKLNFWETSGLPIASRELEELDKILNFYFQYNLNRRI